MKSATLADAGDTLGFTIWRFEKRQRPAFTSTHHVPSWGMRGKAGWQVSFEAFCEGKPEGDEGLLEQIARLGAFHPFHIL